MSDFLHMWERWKEGTVWRMLESPEREVAMDLEVLIPLELRLFLVETDIFACYYMLLMLEDVVVE